MVGKSAGSLDRRARRQPRNGKASVGADALQVATTVPLIAALVGGRNALGRGISSVVVTRAGAASAVGERANPRYDATPSLSASGYGGWRSARALSAVIANWPRVGAVFNLHAR